MLFVNAQPTYHFYYYTIFIHILQIQPFISFRSLYIIVLFARALCLFALLHIPNISPILILSMDNLAGELKNILQGDVEDSQSARTHASCDASIFEVMPRVVVFPKHAEDVQALVSFVNANRDHHLSLTARSAGTCMSGGPLNESIIIDFTRFFTHFHGITGSRATVEPGVYYRDFEKQTLQQNLLLPSYTASRDLCTVGGMVANNSGGEKSLRYGKTARYVKELSVVLADGNQYQIRPLTADELAQKKRLSSFEGDIYRGMHALITEHHDLIQSARPPVSKNSAGYALWDIWNRDTNLFDLTQLFVGSQGTLGLTTNITFSLIEPKKHSKLLIIFLRDLAPLADIVNTVLQFDPESFESYDDQTLALAVKFFPSMVRLMGTSHLLKLGMQFLPEFWMTLTGGVPKLVLMAEFTGDSEQEVDDLLRRAHEAIRPYHVPTRVTSSEQEAQKYWTIRRQSFQLLRSKIKDRHTAPFIDDMVVRAADLPQFLPRLNTILKEYNLTYTIAGHVGNGNFHIIPLMNLADPAQRDIIFELSERVYGLVFEFHGSITGEHNDGLIRTPYLQRQFGPLVYDLFRRTKTLFDPHGIFNPGKKIGATVAYAKSHIKVE